MVTKLKLGKINGGVQQVMKVGVVGFGYWGPNIVRNLQASADFDLVAIADRSDEARRKISRLYPGLEVLEDADDLIVRQDIEAVVIVTPVATHFPIGRKALLAGKHVLIEKPLCTSVAEAEELVAIAKCGQRTLMVDHTFLFSGPVQTIRQVAAGGGLGKICYFDSIRVNLGLFQPDVNVLWDLAPHDLSIICALRDDEIVGVEATGYCHVNAMLPDMAYVTIHFADDAVAHLNLSWMSPVKVRRFAIGGTDRMLIWDDLDQDQKIRIYSSGIEFQPETDRSTIIPDYRIGDIYSPRVPRNEALAGVVGHFANVINGSEASIMDGRAGLRVVRILEDAQQKLDVSLRDLQAKRKDRR